MREWHFEEKIYKKWLILMIGPHAELLDELKQVNYDDVNNMPLSEGYNVRLTLDNSDVHFTIIWLPKYSQHHLAHELVHFVMNTFNNTYVPIGFENEEVFAYYMEYWMREINRMYRKYPNGRTAAQAKKGL